MLFSCCRHMERGRGRQYSIPQLPVNIQVQANSVVLEAIKLTDVTENFVTSFEINANLVRNDRRIVEFFATKNIRISVTADEHLLLEPIAPSTSIVLPTETITLELAKYLQANPKTRNSLAYS